MVNVLKFRTLVVCQIGLGKQCRPRSDCQIGLDKQWRPRSDCFPVCYSLFLQRIWTVKPEKQHFIWEQKEKSVQNFRTVCKCDADYACMVNVLILNTSCLPNRPGQTVQTMIRLLLQKQSDQGLRCLLFLQPFCELQPRKAAFYLRTEREKCSKF